MCSLKNRLIFRKCGTPVLLISFLQSLLNGTRPRCVLYLHGQQAGQVDLRDSLGPLSLPQAASAVFGQLWLLTGFYQMPQPHSTFICILQHWRLCTHTGLMLACDSLSGFATFDFLHLSLHVPHKHSHNLKN